MNDTTRQWLVLQHIPRHPRKITVKQIIAELTNYPEFTSVSERTIQRNVLALRESFPIQNDERNRPYGWSWCQHSAINLPTMTVAEATAFVLIKQFLSTLLPPSYMTQLTDYFDIAEKHLRKLSINTKTTHWSNKVRIQSASQPLIPPRINPDVQAQIYEALWRDLRFSASYTKRDEPTQHYTLTPLGLLQRGAVTYLLASENDEAPVKMFALNRFTNVTLLQGRTKPQVFDIDEYLNAGAAGFSKENSMIDLEVLFTNRCAQHLYETPLTTNQTLTPLDNDSVKLTANIALTPQIKWWLLSFGEQVKVLAPQSLRLEFKCTAEKMAMKYVK